MTLPTVLTLLRILLAAPICILIAAGSTGAVLWAFALFVLACLTDYVDGAIARRFDMASDLGRMLDHIADKLLVAVVAVTLVAVGQIAGWGVAAVILLISRELFIAGMREHVAGRTVVLTVSWTAKWKTTVQMLALGLLIVAPALPDTLQISAMVHDAGTIGLWLAVVLSLVSGYGYFRAGLAAMGQSEEPLPVDPSDAPPADPPPEVLPVEPPPERPRERRPEQPERADPARGAR
jgi:cardiolipin synthase